VRIVDDVEKPVGMVKRELDGFEDPLRVLLQHSHQMQRLRFGGAMSGVVGDIGVSRKDNGGGYDGGDAKKLEAAQPSRADSRQNLWAH
jgi:hypothetical protein